ncbi:MFS transporter [Nocardia sp. XZ_19_369]|uniref:MFS transporter n=1 Tax=Nocardia sp. XZ_19_369 TaxID=2769487 RepID=UPI00188E4346|nr:MFS transporter [Nocardia sp. XZ_19_369]
MTEQALAPAVPAAVADTGPHRYRFVALGIGVGAQASFTALAQGLPAVGPGLQQQWHLSLPQTGALLTAVSLGAATSMLGWGLIVDWIGERTVLTAGLTAAAVATACAAFASSYPVLLGLLILAGVCGGCCSSATGRAVMRWFTRDQRGLALGIRQTAPTLGAAAGAAMLPPVAAAYGMRAALLVLAAGMLSGAALSATGLRTPSATTSPTSAGGLTVLTNRHIWRITGAAMCAVTAQTTLVVYSVAYLVGERQVDLHHAAIVLTVGQLAGAAARVGAGRWSDRVHSRTTPIRQLTLVTTVGLVMLAIAMSGPAITIYAIGIVVFVTASSSYGLFVTSAVEIAGAERAGSATGMLNSFMYGAGAIVPIGIGMICASSWRLGLLALAAISGVGWLLSGPLPARENCGWTATTTPRHSVYQAKRNEAANMRDD